MARLPQNVRQVLREFPGVSVVRAHQIAKDRDWLRRRAREQARRNLYGELPHGGIGASAHALVESFDL